MFGLGNIFSGLGNLFTVPNMMQAMDYLGGGLDVYSQINDMLNPQKMPDFPRLDRQGNPGQAAPSPTPAMSPQQAQQFAQQSASARNQMAERGVYSGGAAENPLATMPGLFQDGASGAFSPETLYAFLNQGQALPYEDDVPYGGF